MSEGPEKSVTITIPKDRESKEWRKFVAWVVATLVFPFVAYSGMKTVTPDVVIEFDVPTIVVLSLSWALVSFLMRRYIRENL